MENDRAEKKGKMSNRIIKFEEENKKLHKENEKLKKTLSKMYKVNE